MKKFLCLVLVLILAMSVLCACAKNETVTKDAPVQTEEKSEATPPASSGSEATAPEHESSSEESAALIESATPDVYLATNATDNEIKISYHLEGCSATKGLTTQKINWDIVKALGFRQCEKCRPPKYEGYID